MTWTNEQIAGTIDHAVLKPVATDNDVRQACLMVKQYNIACLCVHPCDIALATSELEGSSVQVGAVVGFPHGIQVTEVKTLEARLALADGSDELDMVMNIGRFLSEDDDYVRRDIAAVVGEAKKQNAIVKVIIETPYLDPKQIVRACELVRDGGADYVKTSTGFAGGPATLEAVRIMIDTVGDVMCVKAAGGIRTREQAIAFLELGCKRIGTSATEDILSGNA